MITAIMGANTLPIRYKKSVMSARGRMIAPSVPKAVTISATILPEIFLPNGAPMDSDETPALFASKNVVVTVEKMMMIRPAAPMPVFSMICAMSDSPVKIAIDMPMAYIQQLTRPYTIELAAVAATGFAAVRV